MKHEIFQKSYNELTIKLLGKDEEDLTNLMDRTFSLKGGEDERFSLEQLVALAGLIKELVNPEDKFTLNLGRTEITDDTITVLLGISDNIAIVKVMRELTDKESTKLQHNLPGLTVEEVISTDRPITIKTGEEHWTINSSHALKSEAPKTRASHRQEVLDSLKAAHRTFVALVEQNEKLAKEITDHKVDFEKAITNSKTDQHKKEVLKKANALLNHYTQLITGLQVNLPFADAPPAMLLKILEDCSTEPQIDADEYKLWRDQFLKVYAWVNESVSDKDAQIPEVICHEIDKLILIFLDYISVNENITPTELATPNNSLMKKERDTLRNTAKALTSTAISPAFHLVKELINPSEMNFFNQEAGAGGMSLTVSWKRILLIVLEVVDFAPNDKTDTVRNLLREIEAFLSIVKQHCMKQTNTLLQAINSYTGINGIYNPLYSSAFKIISYLNVLGLTDKCFKERPTFSKENPRWKSVDEDGNILERIGSANKIIELIGKLVKNNKQTNDINLLLDSEIRPIIASLKNKVGRQQTSDSSVDRPNGFFASAPTTPLPPPGVTITPTPIASRLDT